MGSLVQPLADLDRASRSHFELEVQGLAQGALAVVAFTSQDHVLSTGYCFSIEVLGRIALDAAQLLGEEAQLLLRWAGDHTRIHGIVSQVSLLGGSSDGERYRLELASPLWLLTQNRHNRVFLAKTVLEIVADVLREAGLAEDAFRIDAADDYPVREYVAQYEESDYEFVCRLLAHDGLCFAFEQGEARAVLVIHDDSAALSETLGAVPLPFERESGQLRRSETVFALRRHLRLSTAGTRLNDYNEQAPERSLVVNADSTSSLAAHGCDYRYGEHYPDQAQGERLARLRQQALDWQRETAVVETDCRGLAPGKRLSLSRHPEPALDGDWLVVEVEHQGDQRQGHAGGGANHGPTYRNRALLIRADRPYRPPVAARRSVYGIFTARIEGDGGDYAYLDEQGRYRIRLPWDLGEAASGEASHPVRLMQPYGGERHGMHFPLHHGAEVAVSCVNGDIDRPIVLGVLSNPAAASPVAAANASQNILRTWGGNELLMEDRQGEERIELFTRERQNILSLDAKADAHLVRLASEQGEMELHAGRSMLIECGDSQTTQVGADHLVTVEQAQRLMTRNAEIELQAATDVLMKAAANVRFTAESGDVELRAERDCVVQTGGALSVEVRNRDASFLIEQGSFSVEAKGAITFKGQGNGKIHIGQAGGAIEISEEGDLTIDAPSVEITADAIAIKGKGVSNN